MQQRAMVDGVMTGLEEARLGILDAGVARGDGGFETAGVWDGRVFRLPDHLLRLDASLAALALPAAPRDLLAEEAAALLEGWEGDGALRVYVTASGTRILTLSVLPDRPDPRVLVPRPAPWIQPAAAYEPAGAKSMSYGPNMAATRWAVRAGGDDALLCSVPGGLVLEGPTFGVLLVVDGVVHAPDVELGIIDSISRRTVLEVAAKAGIGVRQGRWPLELVAEADEVVVMSSLRAATAVRRVGRWTLPEAHPVTDALDAGLWARRRG